MAFMTYLKCVEAGADVLDTAISPMSGGTSQPATETLAYALREMGYEVALNDKKLIEIADFFKGVRADALKSGLLDPISMATDTQCLTYQIPGGMLSNLISQLKMMNAIDKLDQALAETPKVRKDLGYPPLVTPTSQLVGSQAVQNVLAGERYKVVGKEIKAYCRGEYGRTPAPIDPEIQKKIVGGAPLVEGRFADTLEPGFEAAKAELGAVARCDEDVLSYIAFPQVAMAFFKDREAGFPKKEEPAKAESKPAPAPKPAVPVTGPVRGATKSYVLTVNGKNYAVSVAVGDQPLVYHNAPAAAPVPKAAPAPAPAPAPVPAPVTAPTPVAAAPAAPASAAPKAAPAAGETPVNSPMPGNIFKVECKEGQSVKAGDVLVILEAMKMEIEVTAPCDGVVKKIAAAVGSAVNTDDLLVMLG